MKLQPYDFPEAKPNRMKAFFDGDSVPKPLGFSAFRPEWLRSSRPACGGAQDSLKGAQDTRTPLAGFSVTLYGRFWGDH
jgi:hypothetical protein